MNAPMTLEQVSSSIHNAITDSRGLTPQAMREWCDALDAIIAARGEAVATIHRDGYWTYKAGKDPFPFSSKHMSLKVYTQPPEPKVDMDAETGRLCDAIGVHSEAMRKTIRAALTAVLENRDG